MPPLSPPAPTVREAVGESGAPVAVKPYTVPSPHPTYTFPFTPLCTGALSWVLRSTPVHVPPMVTMPPVPQLVSMLGCGGDPPEHTSPVQKTFLIRTIEGLRPLVET